MYVCMRFCVPAVLSLLLFSFVSFCVCVLRKLKKAIICKQRYVAVLVVTPILMRVVVWCGVARTLARQGCTRSRPRPPSLAPPASCPSRCPAANPRAVSWLHEVLVLRGGVACEVRACGGGDGGGVRVVMVVVVVARVCVCVCLMVCVRVRAWWYSTK